MEYFHQVVEHLKNYLLIPLMLKVLSIPQVESPCEEEDHTKAQELLTHIVQIFRQIIEPKPHAKSIICLSEYVT
jgi:hypothetical protein